MKFLLDTHTFIWFVEDDPLLSIKAKELIEDPGNDILLSIASIWKMAIKISTGKLTISQSFHPGVSDQLLFYSIELLPITFSHTAEIISLPFHHRDPFDRMIVAQSLVESIPIIGIDSAFNHYGVQRLW